jgi:hypothetical protein
MATSKPEVVITHAMQKTYRRNAILAGTEVFEDAETDGKRYGIQSFLIPGSGWDYLTAIISAFFF